MADSVGSTGETATIVGTYKVAASAGGQPAEVTGMRVLCRDRPVGLIHEYTRLAQGDTVSGTHRFVMQGGGPGDARHGLASPPGKHRALRRNLDPRRRRVLRDMAADAIDLQLAELGRPCPDCDRAESLICAWHARILARVEAYRQLAQDLGVDL